MVDVYWEDDVRKLKVTNTRLRRKTHHVPAGYEMLVESEDRVQANTVIARASSPRTPSRRSILAAIDGHIYIEPEDDGGYRAIVRREDVEEWIDRYSGLGSPAR